MYTAEYGHVEAGKVKGKAAKKERKREEDVGYAC
jgi:hypothetical protein